MEKRVVLFLIISLVIVFAYPYLIRRIAPSPAAGKKPLRASEPPRATSGGERAPRGEANLAVSDKEQLIVDTDLYTAVFSSHGGVLASWSLKRYRNELAKGAEEKEGSPIELVTAGPASPNPALAIRSENHDFSRFAFRVDGGDLSLLGPGASGSIRFVYSDPVTHEEIIKEYSFRGGTYAFSLKVTTSGLKGGYQLGLGENTGIHSWTQSFGGLVGPFGRVNGENRTENPKKITAPVIWEGDIEIASQQDKYFLAAVYPETPLQGAIEIHRDGEGQLSTDIRLPAAEAEKPQSFGVYLGPKEYDRLQALGRHLEDTIDFGWFIFGSWWIVRIIAKPLFSILQFIYTFSHNYGVAIILVTCLVKSLFLPISLRGVRSMRSMQEIQPKLAALKKKYEKDREKLNREMIELYREHNINPLGGCLPMLIQLPVFVALFNVLYVSIEMRQAPFVFWIHDLSSFDHFYILPILYGATTYLLQRTQPSGMDPQQAKMTAIFIPIFTTGLFLNFPSGLVLYWVLNNLLSIGQQHLMGQPAKG